MIAKTKMSVTDSPSPNFDDREGGQPDMIVLHYTGMQSGAAALQRLCDEKSKVSAHYLVELDGRIYRMVAEEKRAWHAGVSHWAGREALNDCSIGIEIVNPGHWFGYQDFPATQMRAVIELVAEIVTRRNIVKEMVVGHSDIAPTRKEDPGERFPWTELAARNLALFPFDGKAMEEDLLPDYEQCLTALREIGYGFKAPDHASAVLAFQRRFCPRALGQGFDPLTRTAILHVRQQITKI
jgi:N-acetylmuramoyl-L-alanine amidase